MTGLINRALLILRPRAPLSETKWFLIVGAAAFSERLHSVQEIARDSQCDTFVFSGELE